MTVNPILAFSARRRMRSWRTAALISLYGLAVLIFGLAMSFGSFLEPTVSLYTMSAGQEGYAAMMIFQFVLLLLVTPAMTAGSISGERERQTLDLLLVTHTGSLRIVLGKLLESLGIMVLLVFATLPAMCLSLLNGGMTLLQVLEGLLFLCVTAFAMLSVGMLCSSLLRRTVAATVVAYLAVFAIGLVTLLPLISDLSGMAAGFERIYSSSYMMPAVGTADAGSVRFTSFVLNPALGLFSLIAAQTGLLRSLLSNFSYSLYTAYDYLDFAGMARLSMLFMFLAGLTLDLLAACFVRPRKARVRKGKKQ